MNTCSFTAFCLALATLAAPLSRADAALSSALPVAPVGDAVAPSAPATASVSETADIVIAEVARQISDQLRVEGELQLDWGRAWTPPAALPPAAPVQVFVTEFPTALSPSLLVRVRLSAAGASLGEPTLVFRAQLMREVWVTRGPTEREGAFDAAQLDARKVDVLREREAIAVTERISDFNYTRSVPAGRVVTWRDLARRSLVRRGQIIDVAAVEGPMTITMKAVAMENGSAGETVRVRNLESKKEFNALVVATARAEVRF